MIRPPVKTPSRLVVTLVLSVILGFGAGAVGMLMTAAFVMPPPTTVTVTPPPKATMAVNSVEPPRLAQADSALGAAVTIYEEKTGPDLPEAAYLAVDALGSGMVLTSDGWIVAQAASLKSPSRHPGSLVALVDGQRFPVTATIKDPYSGIVFFKVEARDLPVVAMNSQAKMVPGDSLFAFDSLGGIHRLEVIAPQAALAEKTGDLIRSSERLAKYILGTVDPTLIPGTMVLNDRAEAVGLVLNQSRFGTVITPLTAFDDVIDDVLKGKGPQRAYLGVHYLDLAEAGDPAGSGQPGKGVMLAASADQKTPAVEKGSPAEGAGLRAGDVITAVNGEEVTSRNSLPDILTAYAPGMSVTISFKRADRPLTADMILTKAK